MNRHKMSLSTTQLPRAAIQLGRFGDVDVDTKYNWNKASKLRLLKRNWNGEGEVGSEGTSQRLVQLPQI